MYTAAAPNRMPTVLNIFGPSGVGVSITKMINNGLHFFLFMGWYRWRVCAPNNHSINTSCDTVSDYTPKSLSLYDTSPSLVGTLPPNDPDVFVPESQFPPDGGGGISTPKTDITMDFVVQTSLRQRKVRTVDRVTSVEVVSAIPSPIKKFGLFDCSLVDDVSDVRRSRSHAVSPKKLFTTSPNLLTSTPLTKPLDHRDLVEEQVRKAKLLSTECTQILFDTPSENTPQEEHYSGHLPVFLPASFEALNIGCVISEPDISSPVVPPQTGQVRSIAVETSSKTLDITSTRKRSRFRSSPPPSIEGKRRRVSFATNTVKTPSTTSTASVLSSIDNGKLEKKYLEQQKLKVVSTPILKYDIPSSISVKKEIITRSSLVPVSVKTTKTVPVSVSKQEKEPPYLPVWARWKPDKPHFLVPADLLEPSGSSTRSIWRARLHNNMSHPITLTVNDFVKLSDTPLSGLKCRLTKKPSTIVVVESWNGKVVQVKREDTGELMTVPSRHLYLDNTNLLKHHSVESPDGKLFQHLRFLITCGDKSTVMGKSIIQDMIKKHGGTVIDRIVDYGCTTNVLLIANQPKRTFKYLMAVILGIPRVNVQWVVDCAEKGIKWPTESPAYTVDSFSPVGLSRPLCNTTWSVNKEKESKSFYHEFTIILRALGAMVGAEGDFLLTSRPSSGRRRRRVVSAEQLVDCILEADFSSIL